MCCIHIQCIFRLPSSYSSWLVVVIAGSATTIHSSCFCCTSRSSNSVFFYYIELKHIILCRRRLPPLPLDSCWSPPRSSSLATWSLLFWGLQIIFASSCEKYKIVAICERFTLLDIQQNDSTGWLYTALDVGLASDGGDINVNLVQQYDCEPCGSSSV